MGAFMFKHKVWGETQNTAVARLRSTQHVVAVAANVEVDGEFDTILVSLSLACVDPNRSEALGR